MEKLALLMEAAVIGAKQREDGENWKHTALGTDVCSITFLLLHWCSSAAIGNAFTNNTQQINNVRDSVSQYLYFNSGSRLHLRMHLEKYPRQKSSEEVLN